MSTSGRNSAVAGIFIASASLLVSLLAWISPFSPVGPSPLSSERQSLEVGDSSGRLPENTSAVRSNEQSHVGVAPKSARQIAPPPPPVTPSPRLDPQSLYNSAYNSYLRGEYDLALRSFEEYVQHFSGTELADNATYWIGECRYRQRQYNEAIDQFGQLLSRYPHSDKQASALLKKGYALVQLGYRSNAVNQLQEVIRRFPTSDEAGLARQRLRELGVGGVVE